MAANARRSACTTCRGRVHASLNPSAPQRDSRQRKPGRAWSDDSPHAGGVGGDVEAEDRRVGEVRQQQTVYTVAVQGGDVAGQECVAFPVGEGERRHRCERIGEQRRYQLLVGEDLAAQAADLVGAHGSTVQNPYPSPARGPTCAVVAGVEPIAASIAIQLGTWPPTLPAA